MHSCSVRHDAPRLLWLLTGAAALLPLVVRPALAQTSQTFTACYVPTVGAIYLIRQPGLPQNCLSNAHTQITWREGVGGAVGGDLTGSLPNPTVAALRGHPLSAAAPANGQLLTWNGNAWAPAAPAAGASAHGQLGGLTADDHPQYLPTNGTRPMTGNLNAGGNRVVGLGAAASPSDAVRSAEGIENGDAAGGDLAGSFPMPSVVRLQGRAVATTAPSSGQVLAWTGTAWAPVTLPAAQNVSPGGDLSGALSSATVIAIQGRPVSTAAPAVGETLVWNGTAWVAASPGLPAVSESSQDRTLSPQQSLSVTVSCPGGRSALSPGWSASDPALVLTQSRRETDGSGWSFTWTNSSATNSADVRSTVYCGG